MIWIYDLDVKVHKALHRFDTSCCCDERSFLSGHSS